MTLLNFRSTNTRYILKYKTYRYHIVHDIDASVVMVSPQPLVLSRTFSTSMYRAFGMTTPGTGQRGKANLINTEEGV